MRATFGAFSCRFAAALLLASSPVLAAKELTPHQVYEKASSAVVVLQVDDAMGSGFLVSSDGKLVTNFHVVAHTKNATVRLENGDAYDDVQILDIDKRKDIAILRIKAVDLPFLKLGKSADEEDIGSTVYTISNPAGYHIYQNTLSQGLISSVRTLDGFHVVQITAPISHGSSGGPLFNAKGEVIGITSSTDDKGQNLNFAIPADYVRGLLASPGQARTLASVYDPSPTSPLSSQQAFKAKALSLGTVVGRYTAMFLTTWFVLRLMRKAWLRNNESPRYITTRTKLWIKVGWPAVLCAGMAIVMVLEDAIMSSK